MQRIARGAFGLVGALLLTGVVAGCADPPPAVSTAPSYQAPHSAAGKTATISNMIMDPGVMLANYWVFVSSIDGHPLYPSRGELVATVITAGPHVVEVGCLVDGSNTVASTSLQVDIQADHSYVVECVKVGTFSRTYTLSVEDRTTETVIAQDSAVKPLEFRFIPIPLFLN